MVYQGSKNKLAKWIAPIIQEYIEKNQVDTYIELFVGGANMIDKIKCKRKIGCDINEDLIALLKYAQADEKISIAPNECTYEHYIDVRNNQNTGKYSKEYVSLIGYMASYGGKYFNGGYGRDSKGGRSIYNERLKNFRKQAPNLKGIEFYCGDYNDFKIERFKNCVIYLDPPYRATTQYSKQKINYEKFYDFCEKMAEKNIVLISEFEMPDDKFISIWEHERKVLQQSDRQEGKNVTEKLFICKRGAINEQDENTQGNQ